MNALEEGAEEKNGQGKNGSHEEGEVDTVDKRAVAIFSVASAERLRDERVQADEDPFAEKGQDVEEIGTDADSADGYGAVGKTADHHGVDNIHAHPANFGQDQREGQTQCGAKFGAEGGEGEHGSAGKSLSGERAEW